MDKKLELRSAGHWLIKAGLFIVPFIPLYVSKILFFPYITGKAFVFRIIVEIIFAVWIFLAVFYKEYRPKLTPLLIAVSFFILISALATVFSISPARSFWSNFERMEGLVSYLHLFAYFLVLTHVFSAKGGSASGGQKLDWKIFLNLFVIAAIYENTYAFFQKIGILMSPQGGSNRADGTIGNPTYLAAYLIFILGFCLLLWLEAKEKWQKYFYGAMAAWTLLTIYFTATRGATLGIIGGMIFFGISYLFFKRTREPGGILAKKITVALLLVSLLVPAGIWFFRDSSFIKNNPTLSRLTSLSLSERTITSRFTIWAMSFEASKEHPVLGWGPENYAVVFSKYFRPELWQQEPWFDRSHNIVFDWLINAGVFGVLAYFGMFAVAIYSLWQHFRKNNIVLEQALLIVSLLLVYLAQNFFVFDQIATYICFFTVLAYINSFSAKENISVLPTSRQLREPNGWIMVAGVLFIPLATVMYVVNIRPLSANLDLLSALAAQNADFAFDKFTQALAYNTLGKEETREQLIRFSINAGASPDLSAEFRDKILRRAIEEAQMGVAENPLDPRPYLFLGMIYQKVGLSDQALEVFNKAIELSPKKQQIYFELADVYLQDNNYSKAAEVLETAFNLDKDFYQARSNLAVIYILNNQQKLADDLLIESFGTVEVTDIALISIYSRIKDYNRLAGIWRAFVKKSPDNFEYRKNLAGAYLLANDKNSAIKVLTDAQKDFPLFNSEIEGILKQIFNEVQPR